MKRVWLLWTDKVSRSDWAVWFLVAPMVFSIFAGGLVELSVGLKRHLLSSSILWNSIWTWPECYLDQLSISADIDGVGLESMQGWNPVGSQKIYTICRTDVEIFRLASFALAVSGDEIVIFMYCRILFDCFGGQHLAVCRGHSAHSLHYLWDACRKAECPLIESQSSLCTEVV